MKNLTHERELAEREFLGRDHVVGVALARPAAELLVFLLDQQSTHTSQRISTWAQRHGVDFELRVVGGFRPL
jgi:hypothetical protein